MIKVENLTKSFGENKVFNDLNLTINDGDIVGIIGPSGSGKSLLLQFLMLLEKPDSGNIFLDGENLCSNDADLDMARERIGMVFQNFNLFSHLSVVENVMSGLVHLRKMNKVDAYNKALDLLRSVGLYDKAYAYPYTLSGGQKQRAAIARTIAMEPEIIFFDEPTSALDPANKGEVEAVIRMLAAKGNTMVIVSHEMNLLMNLCNKIVFLKDGIVFDEGTPEEILVNPKNRETRRFVRELRVLEFEVDSKDFDFIGMNTTILQFSYRNGIPTDLVNHMQAVIEELCQMIIISQSEGNQMKVIYEYNSLEKAIAGTVYFTGDKFDEDDPRGVFSLPLIRLHTKSLEFRDSELIDFTNRVNMIIQ